MRQKLLGAALLLGTALFAGCGGGYGYSYVTYGPPPPPRYGVVGVAPGPGYVWINGYYGWSGGRYVWNQGRWALPPHGRHAWVEGGWHREGRGWRYHEGHWR